MVWKAELCEASKIIVVDIALIMDDFPLPEPPAKDRNVLAIELISGSFGGAAQVLVGQVRWSCTLTDNSRWTH